jgi:hypothetical protein
MTRCPSDLELERHLLGDAPPALELHVADCAACAARLAEMREEGEDFRREVFPATVDAVVARARPRPLSRPWVLAAAPLAAAAAAALFLLGRPPPDYVGAKGGELSLAVFVQAPGGAQAAADGAAVPAGAAVRFQVRSARPCQLWVVSVDAEGLVSRLFPAGGDAPARIAEAGPLPGGAVLDGRAGPERIFAVCSDAPLALADVERAARGAAGGSDARVRAGGRLEGLPAGAAQATLLLEKRP